MYKSVKELLLPYKLCELPYKLCKLLKIMKEKNAHNLLQTIRKQKLLAKDMHKEIND